MARRDDPGPYSLEALAQLPTPALLTTDASAWKARLVEWFEGETGRTLYPMQVEMLQIEAVAYAMSVLGEEGQMVAEQHLVAKASLLGLLTLGANRSTPRLAASHAVAKLRFLIAQARPTNTFIGQGTRVSAGDFVFVTTAPAVIVAGALMVEVVAQAEVAGAAGNGFLPGQISTMLDPIAGVAVTNLAESEGGADAEDVELYRLRVANAFDRVSTGGSHGWYRETAMTVSSAIVDVGVVRPQPCYVDIYPLTTAGAAGVALRDQVKSVFDTQANLDIRFGDEVTIKAATAVVATPTLTVRLRGETAGAAVVAASGGNALLTEWRERLASAVSHSQIEEVAKAALKAGGFDVVDIEVGSLPFQQLAAHEFLAAVPFVADAVAVSAVNG